MPLRTNRISTTVRAVTLAICLLAVGAVPSYAQAPRATTPSTNAEQEVLKVSKQKWDWMSERNVDALAALFHEQCMFVHLGATMSKTQELDVIKSGRIEYKKADIEETSVKFFSTTAIVLTKMHLLAEVTVFPIRLLLDRPWIQAQLSKAIRWTKSQVNC